MSMTIACWMRAIVCDAAPLLSPGKTEHSRSLSSHAVLALRDLCSSSGGEALPLSLTVRTFSAQARLDEDVYIARPNPALASRTRRLSTFSPP